MELGEFERRRQEQMIEKGDDISSLTAASPDKIEVILSGIDTILGTFDRGTELPYNVKIRQHIESLRGTDKSDDEIYDKLVNEHLARHPMLARELGRRGITPVGIGLSRPDSEFDQ